MALCVHDVRECADPPSAVLRMLCDAVEAMAAALHDADGRALVPTRRAEDTTGGPRTLVDAFMMRELFIHRMRSREIEPATR